jgi:hypothetical protein
MFLLSVIDFHGVVWGLLWSQFEMSFVLFSFFPTFYIGFLIALLLLAFVPVLKGCEILSLVMWQCIPLLVLYPGTQFGSRFNT